MIKVSDLDMWNQSVKMLLAKLPTIASNVIILINSRTNFIKIVYIPLNMPISLPPSPAAYGQTYFSRPWLAGFVIYPAGVYDNTCGRKNT